MAGNDAVGDQGKESKGGILAAIHSHPRVSWAALIAYAAAVTFPHEDVQWAVNILGIWTGRQNLYWLSAAVALALGAVATVFLIRALARRREQRRMVGGLWALTLLLIFGAWRMLTANNVELVHYPQYFPEGVALAALTLSPVEALSWIVIFGGLDEGYQYWVLSQGRPTLFDFNDIYMDLLGGAAGVVFGMAFLRCLRQRGRGQGIVALKRPGVAVMLSIIALGILLWELGVMLLVEDKANTHYWFALGRFRTPTFWFQVVANGPNKYHTLSPVEGTVLILATIGLYGARCRKWALFAKG